MDLESMAKLGVGAAVGLAGMAMMFKIIMKALEASKIFTGKMHEQLLEFSREVKELASATTMLTETQRAHNAVLIRQMERIEEHLESTERDVHKLREAKNHPSAKK